MRKISLNSIFRVESIRLKDGGAISNVDVMFTDKFLIVSDPKKDLPPNFYNIDMVDRLLGVEEQKAPTTRNVWM